ncbi:MAG: molybdopterin cofactor-binding domain-containing protein, partial [Pseudomonadota bacterium]
MSRDTQPTDIVTRFGSGRDVPRIEDEGLLKGQGRYTDDLAPDGHLRLCFVRSPHPHARILRVDADQARAMPGVKYVVTGAELEAAGVKPLPVNTGFKRPGGGPSATAPRRALAYERVRFVGEPVAAVVADSFEQARDAAEAVWVEYEELPHVIDPIEAMRPGAPALCKEAPDNIAAEARYGDVAACAAGFAKAVHVVTLDLVNQRVSALALEPRAVLGWVADDGRLTIRMGTQMPSGVRNSVCDSLGLAREQVRVTVGDVGGGFGMKTGIYPEDVVVAWCAWQLKRPVKWSADRSEEFLSAVPGRDLRTHAEMALAADGRVLGLRLKSTGNVGAYALGTGAAIQLMIGPWVQTSVYDIPIVDFHFQSVMTNTAPIA